MLPGYNHYDSFLLRFLHALLSRAYLDEGDCVVGNSVSERNYLVEDLLVVCILFLHPLQEAY